MGWGRRNQDNKTFYTSDLNVNFKSNVEFCIFEYYLIDLKG